MAPRKGIIEEAQAGVAAVAKQARKVVDAVARSRAGRTAAATVLAAAAETLLEPRPPRKAARKPVSRTGRKTPTAKRKAPTRKLAKR